MGKGTHGHHGDNTTSNVWTKLGTAGEIVSSLISDTYWLGGLIDVAFQLDDAGYGLSTYGMAFGTALAVMTAAGSGYAHNIVNRNHQKSSEQHAHHAHDEECGHAHADTQGMTTPLADSHSHDKSPSVSLSWPQKLALNGDFVSHVGDVAGPITFVADLAFPEQARATQMVVRGLATAFGIFSSVANRQTCKKNMLESNAKEVRPGASAAA